MKTALLRRKKFTFNYAVLCGLLATGCAPLKTVTISSTPPDAIISIDGNPGGKAPFETTLDFSGGKTYTVTASKDDFEDTSIQVGFDPPATVGYSIKLPEKVRVMIRVVHMQPTRGDAGLELRPVSQETLAYKQTMEKSATCPIVSKQTSFDDPNSEVGIPAMCPTDECFVYAVSQGGEKDFSSSIYKQDVGSTAKARMTTGNWRDIDPAFSPDGKFVYFSSNRSGQRNLVWRLNVGGTGGITKITQSEATDYAPSLGGAGDFVVFNSIPPGVDSPQIWSVGTNSSQPTQFREGEQPKLSPDGKKILFIRNGTEMDKSQNRLARQLWVMAVDGANESQLVSNWKGDVKDPSWSPDGRWIMFSSDAGQDTDGTPNYDVYIMSANGNTPNQLTTNGSWDDGPVMDHRQEFIYFRSNRGGHFNIWRMPTANLGVEQLKDPAGK